MSPLVYIKIHCTLSNVLYLAAIIICLSAGVHMFATFKLGPDVWQKYIWEALISSGMLIVIGVNLEHRF